VDCFIKIVFVNAEENDSDLFTKNVNKDTFKEHLVMFLGKIDL
jgi:hypothetical protein